MSFNMERTMRAQRILAIVFMRACSRAPLEAPAGALGGREGYPRAALLKAVCLFVIGLSWFADGLNAQTAHADGRGDITIALTGDAIITRKLSVYNEPEFVRLREIVQDATVAFTNLEILFFEYGPGIIPAEESGGTYMRAAPEIAEELTWMGFDLVSRANNHTMDYGTGGMRATTRAVEAAGLMHAGAGENLAEARAPTYLETPDGRVALISAASTFADAMRAGAQRKDMRGRPGLNPIRYETEYVVPSSGMAALRELRAGFDPGEGDEDADRVRFMGNTFVAGDDYGEITTAHEGDLEAIVASVRDAKRQANWVIVSSHSHEGAESRDVPAQFLVQFARAVIEAGADMFVGHGPHVLRGIEIHEGKPIFYSLGDFIFQNETVELQPADNYEDQELPQTALPSDFYDRREERSDGGFPANPLVWEGVVAVPVFQSHALTEVRLYPVTLGHGLPRPQRGRPVLATGELAQKIIGDLQRLSEPFGTRIDYVDGVGIVRVGARAAIGSDRGSNPAGASSTSFGRGIR